MVISGALRWFGTSWGVPMNQDCEQVSVPVGDRCARCAETIGKSDQGVLIWHVEIGSEGYRPLHRACFVRQSAGGIDHVLRHARKCAPAPARMIQCGYQGEWQPRSCCVLWSTHHER